MGARRPAAHGTPTAAGSISAVELTAVQDRPALFSTFLMWLLAELFEELPEVGDLDRPKLVFFFDEAHLLFTGASKAFLEAVTQTVRLIRSKGVGIFFVTQNPTDVPSAVLGQLGNRVQHALRTFTPEDANALRKTVSHLPEERRLRPRRAADRRSAPARRRSPCSPSAAPRRRSPGRCCGRRGRSMGAGRASSVRPASSPPRRCRPSTGSRRPGVRLRAARREARAAARRRRRHAPDRTPEHPRRTERAPVAGAEEPEAPDGGVVGAVLGSSAFRSFARSAASALGREISRGSSARVAGADDRRVRETAAMSSPQVVVRGEAVLVVEPEIADVDVTVRVRARDRQTALERCSARQDEVAAVVAAAGDAVEVTETTGVSVHLEVRDRRAPGEPVASLHTRLTLGRLDAVGELVVALGRLDDVEVSGPSGGCGRTARPSSRPGSPPSATPSAGPGSTRRPSARS